LGTAGHTSTNFYDSLRQGSTDRLKDPFALSQRGVSNF